MTTTTKDLVSVLKEVDEAQREAAEEHKRILLRDQYLSKKRQDILNKIQQDWLKRRAEEQHAKFVRMVSDAGLQPSKETRNSFEFNYLTPQVKKLIATTLRVSIPEHSTYKGIRYDEIVKNRPGVQLIALYKRQPKKDYGSPMYLCRLRVRFTSKAAGKHVMWNGKRLVFREKPDIPDNFE